MNKRAKKDGRIEKSPAEQCAPAPMQGIALAGVADCVKEAEPRHPKSERRARLIAAHVALEGIRYELEGSWMHIDAVRTEIAAAIGRMELRD